MSGVFVRLHRLLLFSICVFIASSTQLRAQGSASIGGKVLDPDSKVVVNAAIIVRNESTSEIRTTVTDGVGHFALTGLLPGVYTVEVAVPGFEIVRRTSVQAAAGTAAEDLEDQGEITDKLGRVLRGGSFYYPQMNVRSANRTGFATTYRDYDVGFRVARTFR